MSLPCNKKPLSSQYETIRECLDLIEKNSGNISVEDTLSKTFANACGDIEPDSKDFISMLNYYLYQYILKQYQTRAGNLCFWWFIKNLCPDRFVKDPKDPGLKMLDALIRIYLYSDPLDDLTCIFIPISDTALIQDYLAYIKRYFYKADYPTSLLWFYALDSSLASLFPDELIFLGGKSPESHLKHIILPDYTSGESVLFKRYSRASDHFVILKGKIANDEFRQIFAFLKREYKDRCLSVSAKLSKDVDMTKYDRDWGKFEDVLKFGVSDQHESGCVSFSDMRASTEFLNTYGKSIYLNKIQQPFFEKSKLISKKYNGRIDKFMGDNVMCVFLTTYIKEQEKGAEDTAVLNNFFAIFDLCKILHNLIIQEGLEDTRLGLRSGVTFGSQILRSNLGNEFVRDFTVTGETVNLAARLEHISIHELKLHNKIYFKNAIDRFPKISRLISVSGNSRNLNPETINLIKNFTLSQNIYSNLEKLDKARFDIRFNQAFYTKIRNHFEGKGFKILNRDMAEIHGYEEFDINGFSLKFYFIYYNPKGFKNYERICILPLEKDVLQNMDIKDII